jgi:predicted nucleic acid-binding protein
MPSVAIPDTSCLIGLSGGRRLDLLRDRYSEVTVPRAVADEFGEALPNWVSVALVGNVGQVQALRSSLGQGESEVIALALERFDSVAVLDDLRARRIARDLGLRFTGTAGVLLKAKSAGLLPSVAQALQAMTPSGFRLSDDLGDEMLRLAGESGSPGRNR